MEARESLTLLLGGGGCGKTAAALAEYRRTLLAGPWAGPRRALWLAPTFAAAADVREALVAGGGDAFLDPAVMTFAQFVEEVVRDGRRRVRPISSLQRRRALERVIDGAVDDGVLGYFGPVARSPGFLSLVEDWIADRKRASAPSDEQPLRGAAAAEGRTRDLFELYRRYEGQLRWSRLYDLEGLLWLACETLDNSPELMSALELVVADGFADFTGGEHAVLRLLRGRSRRLWVTLVGEGARGQGTGDRGELWAKAAATVRQFEQDGAVELVQLDGSREGGADPSALTRCRVSPRREFESRRDSSTGWEAMAHIERNLFRSFHQLEPPAPEAAATASRVAIVAASSVQAEIEEIARRVKQLLVGGARPGDIVVAFRSTRDVAERVRQALDDFGVPFWLDAPRRLASTPLVRSLVGVLRLAGEDWTYRRVLAAAGDTALAALGGAEARTAIERCVRQAQLPSGRAALLGQVAAWSEASADEGDPNAAQAALAGATLRRLDAALDALPKRAELAAWVAAWEILAQELGLVGDDASRDAGTTWSSLVRGLNEVEQIDRSSGGEKQLDIAEAIDVLTAVAAFLPAAEPHDAAGRVAVLSADAARLARPKHLFVGGLNEQAFAAGRVLDLDQGATAAGDERRTAAADEMLLFYQVVTRARETLTLSYPALDDKAQPLVPSPLLAELERCLAGAPISRTVQSLGYASEEPTTVLSRGELRRAAVVQAMERKRELLAALARESVGAAILDGIEIVASRAKRDRFEAFEGVLASDAVRRWLETQFGPDHLWSPSQLELYATCPFRFFGELALKLEPAPDLALADDLARRGHLLHDALARMYSGRVGAAAGDQATGALIEQFQTALDEAARVRPGRGLHAALREIERRQIASWAEKFAEQDAAYQAAWAHLESPPQPAHFEARFGPASRRSAGSFDATASTDKPFELVVPMAGGEERVAFIGQIDRIDVGRAGGRVVFNVIDYKTSARAVVDERKVYAGTQLQLPLYAMATAELLLSRDNAAALSAGYWSVRGKGFGVGQRTGRPLAINEVRDGAVQPAAGWEAMRAAIVGRLGEIITGIRRGWFPVFNDDQQCTASCSLRTVCRIAHVRSLEKEWTPPAEAP